MRHLLLAAFTLVCSASVFVACSDDAKTPAASVTPNDDAGGTGSSSGSSSGSSGAPIGKDSGGTCTGIEQGGASVDIKATKAPIPEATGGPPVDGDYVLTKVTAFAAIFEEGAVVRAFGAYTLSLGANGTTFEQVVTNPENKVTRSKGALAADGVSFTATPDCEDPLPDAGVTILSGKYSAEGNTLKMYVVRELNITAELVFEKR
jgi:hypothetical protein